MPRGPRLASRTGTYHILCRGNNGQPLFSDSADYQLYLNLLAEGKRRDSFDIYHYCQLPFRMPPPLGGRMRRLWSPPETCPLRTRCEFNN